MGLYFEKSFRKSNFESVLQQTVMELTTAANGFVLFSLITLFGIHNGMYCFEYPESISFQARFKTDLFLFAQRKRFNYFCFKNPTVQIKMYSLAKINIQ